MYYFASDMHLGLNYRSSTREREKLLVRWLDEVSADAEAIILAGDIFDFWYEYKRVVPKGFTRLLGKLSELSDRGIKIHFFTGNHDMWAYDYLQDECGVKIHHKPEVFEAYGKRIFVAHGDNIYLRQPLGVKIMNRTFRSPFIRKCFSTVVHPDLALRFGNWWSNKSRKSKSIAHRFCGEQEYLIQYAREYQKVVPVDYFIFGHLHCAENFDMGEGHRAVFLGEWIVNPTYAVLDRTGDIQLKNYH